MIIFCHIPKTAGTTVNSILWRHFLGRVVEAEPTIGTLYRRNDYERDVAYTRGARVLIGHSIRPYEDYGPTAANFKWFTFLRDPRATLISSYVHHNTSDHPIHQIYKLPFPQWLETFGASRQTAWLAGSYSAESAIATLNGFAAVGLVERFDESLVVLGHRLAVPNLCLRYSAKNLRKATDVWLDAQAFLDDNPRLTEEILGPDMELYAYAKDELFPAQLAELGGERRVAQLAKIACTSPTRADVLRERLGHNLFRAQQRLVYRPASRLVRGKREPVPIPADGSQATFTANLP
jgi:hypothetical protein